jgi:hypothetical protein
VTYSDADFDAMELLDGAYAFEVPAVGVTFVKERVNL